MAVKSLIMDYPGQIGVVPRIGYLNTDDSFGSLFSTGFLDNYVKSRGITLFPTDLIFIVCANGNLAARPTISNGVITLTTPF